MTDMAGATKYGERKEILSILTYRLKERRKAGLLTPAPPASL